MWGDDILLFRAFNYSTVPEYSRVLSSGMRVLLRTMIKIGAHLGIHPSEKLPLAIFKAPLLF
jgi:hypothetical protein